MGRQLCERLIDRGRVKKVYVMSEAKYRMCRMISATGMFVLLMVRWCHSGVLLFSLGVRFAASGTLQRLPSMEILGQAAPGKSTGEAMS